ncbi:MAG: ATP-binding cassette domain-containing protein [Phycisphaerae bacterium]|nr:ATP-binding cassette domain-containing protein [Phycisphaerae bacterium]
MIRLENIRKAFNSQAVLTGVDLDIAAGVTTVVIGPSGCGKTVLLKHIVGILKPDAGKVFFREYEISAMNERQLVSVRRQMGFLFQGSALFDSMTVEKNVCFPLTEYDIGTNDSRRRRCCEVLSLVGMDGTQSKYPEELSGGQKKRVALARAIALNPQVILYDEPTTGLDPIRADLINELILKLRDILGNTAVVVTHDMKSACKVGDRIVMLHEGRLILDTAPEKLDGIDNEVVARFVEGRASKEELAELETGRLAGANPQAETNKATEETT